MTAPFQTTHFWKIVENWQHELLLFSAIWFLIGAIDDLVIDGLWLLNRSGRWLSRYRMAPPMRADELPAPKDPGLIAIFIATWQESQVITAMIDRCRNAWAGGETSFRIYIGCYPNDRAGVAAIMAGCSGFAEARLVMCESNGPTSKADCLNHLWRALVNDELAWANAPRPLSCTMQRTWSIATNCGSSITSSNVQPQSSCPSSQRLFPARAGSAAIIAMNLPRRMARRWSCVRQLAQRSPLRASDVRYRARILAISRLKMAAFHSTNHR